MSPNDPSSPLRRRNRIVAAAVGVIFLGMVGAAYAAVPMYRAFCQLTGYDGTVRKAAAAPDQVLDKTLTIRFDANVNGLPWTFAADQVSQEAKIGETKLATFRVTNNADHPITGRAVFNVVPEQAGAYFQKLECFCFSDQTIGAHQSVDMPVLYFVDPKYASDFETRGKKEITLSYTFYPAADAKPENKVAAAAQERKSPLGGAGGAGL